MLGGDSKIKFVSQLCQSVIDLFSHICGISLMSIHVCTCSVKGLLSSVSKEYTGVHPLVMVISQYKHW